MKNRNKLKRLLSVFICCMMLCTSLPMKTFAEEITETETVTDAVTETVTETVADAVTDTESDTVKENEVLDNKTKALSESDEEFNEDRREVLSKSSPKAKGIDEDSLETVYVSNDGDDNTGDGSQENPVASLSEAVTLAKDGATVYLQTSIEASSLTLVSHKNITIDGGGNTVTRAEEFDRAIDQGRGGYHSAMIEVANGSTLTLVNITLDDAFRTMGEEFKLAGSSSEDNTKKVHDGIIASYGDGHATIVLGTGTTLKNFGGLSAVYITGNGGDGATLIMKFGSKIVDDSNGSRNGGYAAVFNHGGTFTAEAGSAIENIDGRAIYGDNAGVTNFSGTMKNITSNEVMERAKNSGNGGNSFGGIAYYGDGKTQFTLGKSGSITDIKSHDTQKVDVMLELISCTFKTEAGSEISNIQTIGLADMNEATVDIAGSVHDCNTGNVLFRMRGTQSTFKLQQGGTITNNSTTDVALIYLNGGKPTIQIAGTIDGMNKPALFISNNGSRKDGSITVTETGVITNIKGNAITASDPSKVTIQGKITNCSSYAVNYEPKGTGSLLVIDNTAEVSDNNNGKAQIKVAGNLSATDASEHVEIAPGTLIGNTSVDTSSLNVTLDTDYSAIQLGNGNDKAVEEITTSIENDHPNWTVIGTKALWIKPSETSIHFTAQKPYGVKKTGLFAAYVSLDENGNPDGKVQLKKVDNEDIIDVSLEKLTTGKAYALMLVNNDEYTLSPDDTTIYTGGGQGDETYDDGGFPVVTMFNSVDEIEKMTVNGEEVVEDPEKGVTFENTLLGLLDVTYLDEQGKSVDSDNKPGEYTVLLAWKDRDTEVTINDNEVNPELEPGTLIVRSIKNVEETQQGDITYELLPEGQTPAEAVDHAVAVANKYYNFWDPEFYTNDDEARKVDSKGIRLLDDDLLVNIGDGRQELMEQKAAEYLNDLSEGQAYRYDFHYLDLVDSYNGNAWVSAKYGTTVYLPYPEGVTQDTADDLDVKVVHYKDLHREYGIAGHAEVNEAIAATEMETMNVEFTNVGIKFEVGREGFSPFAIVWKAQARIITATAGEGGVISPSGRVVVGEGADKSFLITPNDGYSIAEIKVDGQAIELAGVVDQKGIGTYTFENITADHTIEAIFKNDSTTPGSGEGTDGTGGSGTDRDNTAVDGNTPKTGDDRPIALWLTVMLVSGIGIIFATMYGRKKKKTEK